MNRFKFWAELDRNPDVDPIEVEVTYSVTPYSPATGPTYACGGQPEEGGEIEIEGATFEGVEIPLSKAEVEYLATKAGERSRDDLADAAADYGDYLHDQAKDRRMMEAC